MSDKQQESQDFKTPNPQCSPHDKHSHHGNRKDRRERSRSGNRHRSSSAGGEGKRNPSGDGNYDRNRGKGRQIDYGNDHRRERDGQREEQWEQFQDHYQQNDRHRENYSPSKNYRGRGRGQNRQNYNDQQHNYNQFPRGRGQYRQYDNPNYGHDNTNFQDGSNFDNGQSPQGGYNKSPERGGWGRRGGRHNNSSFSSDGQTPERSHYGRDDSDYFLSKTLSSILRHNAERFGFKLMKGGFLYVDEILQYVHKLQGYTYDDVRRIVDSNDKKRFALEKEEDGRLKIRANQGHSIEVEALDLQPVLSADEVPCVIHGTYFASWEFIKKTGLRRMNRNHIHFAAGEPGENGVISGMRKTCEVMIHIDMGKALKDGLKFFRSANNVILCEGDKDGIIYPCYFSGVLDRIRRHRLEFDDKIAASSTAGEKPSENKKRKKKSKATKHEEITENVEEVTEELKSKESEDGATTDDASLPAAKKQHLNDSKPSDTPDAKTTVDEGASVNIKEDIDTPDANMTVEEGASVNIDEDIEWEIDEVKTKHWNEPHVVKDAEESKGIVKNLCDIQPSHIAVSCVGENLGREHSRIRAIVISTPPDSYVYHLHDENTNLVKKGNLEQLLLSKDIHKVFHDIGAVSPSLINEYDILMDGIPIWDIKVLFQKVTVPSMDLQELKFEETIFKTWTEQNEEYGKQMAAQFDPVVANDLVERGKLMWDLHRLCFKRVNEGFTKDLKKEIFEAAIPSDKFLAEKIKSLKLEKKGKKKAEKEGEKSQQQQQQQQQKQKQQHPKTKSPKKKGKK